MFKKTFTIYLFTVLFFLFVPFNYGFASVTGSPFTEDEVFYLDEDGSYRLEFVAETDFSVYWENLSDDRVSQTNVNNPYNVFKNMFIGGWDRVGNNSYFLTDLELFINNGNSADLFEVYEEGELYHSYLPILYNAYGMLTTYDLDTILATTTNNILRNSYFDGDPLSTSTDFYLIQVPDVDPGVENLKIIYFTPDYTPKVTNDNFDFDDFDWDTYDWDLDGLIVDFKTLYRDYDASTSQFQFGLGFYGVNSRPVFYDNLELQIKNASSTNAGFQEYDVSGMANVRFHKTYDELLYVYPPGVYSANFTFTTDDFSATSTTETFYFTLATSSPVVSWNTWFGLTGGDIDEDIFSDKWGIGRHIKNYLDAFKLKFPFSWLWGTYDLWLEQVALLDTADAVDPLKVVWTMPTSTTNVAFSGAELTIFDLEGANDNYGTAIALFRTIMGYVIWISVLFLVIRKVKAFLVDLRD